MRRRRSVSHTSG